MPLGTVLQVGGKTEGELKIKAEFLVEKEDSKETQQKPRPDNGKWNKEKQRGRNKNRPPPMKFGFAQRLCPVLVDVSPEREKLPDCTHPNCSFQHDAIKYFDSKPDDIDSNCFIYESYGRCKRGVTCSFASDHIIVDREKNEVRNKVFKELADKFGPLKTRESNHLDKELQLQLRKKEYDFKKADSIVDSFFEAWNNEKEHSVTSAAKKVCLDDKNMNSQDKDVEENSADLKINKKDFKESEQKISEPDQVKSEPEQVKSKPEQARSKPDQIQSEPDQVKSELDQVKSEHDQVKSEHDQVKSEPDQVKSEPDQVKSEPEQNKTEPDQAKTLPEEDRSEPKNGKSESATGKRKFETEELGKVPSKDAPLKYYDKPGFKKIDWSGKLYLAPLTTVGNLPYRRICKEFGADITCGEMAMSIQLLQGHAPEWALVQRHVSEDLFGIQLCGNSPQQLTRVAQLIEDGHIDCDFVDLNLGCPIDLVYKRGMGTGLMERKKPLEVMVRSMSAIMNRPLTLKMRTGIQMDKRLAHGLVPLLKEWGIDMITLHGRSREQRYTRLADWGYIKECAEIAKPLPLFGNGDIINYEDYNRVMTESKVDGIMIARGALIKPWIFKEIKEQQHWDISAQERLDMIRRYSNYGMEHWGSDPKGVETTRRFLLEWLSFLHRYVPHGLVEQPPQRMNERVPVYKGRCDLETLLSSPAGSDWVKISEMFLGKVPENFAFEPKHKAHGY